MTQPLSPQFVEVTTTAGTVRGRWREGSAAFLGIPYAEPPVGELRFAEPVAHRPWAGVRDVLEYGATPQRTPASDVTIIPEPSIPGEATLNLNVFTPRPSGADKGLPVLVWIHGGGYVSGSAASPWYDGAAFNRDGVVTVSISYRLGFEGFGWISDAPHNRGVLDWILALEWVRDNISAFGGDPSRVTIAGQSAGGGAVMTLLTVPRARGLFQRVISLSGVPTEGTPGQAEAAGRRLAWLGGAEATRAGLSGLSEERVLELQAQVSNVGGKTEDRDPIRPLSDLLRDGLVFGPFVDGFLIPRPTVEAMRAGIGSDKALLVGSTDHEFNMATAGTGPLLPKVPDAALLARLGAPLEIAEAYLASRRGLAAEVLVGQYVTDKIFRKATLDVAEAYLASRRGLAAEVLVGQYVTDKIFRKATLDVAEARAGAAAPTWVYRFAWRSPVTGDAGHCYDLPFFFDATTAERVSMVAGVEPPAALAEDVHGAAVAFIRDGQPGWKPWDAGDHQVRVFDEPSVDIEDGYADLWMLHAQPTSR